MSRVPALIARLTPRERRTILVSTAVIAGAWIALKALPAGYRWQQDQRARAEQVEMTLLRAREAIVAEPVARESLAARGRRLVALAPRLFAGATTAQAGAELTSWVSGLADARGVRIGRQSLGADSLAAPFRRLALRLDAEGDITGIAGWLSQLEAGPRLVTIEQLAISALEPAAPAAQPERLRAELVLVAWNAPPPPGVRE